MPYTLNEPCSSCQIHESSASSWPRPRGLSIQKKNYTYVIATEDVAPFITMTTSVSFVTTLCDIIRTSVEILGVLPNVTMTILKMGDDLSPRVRHY
jgi:hypothetical protein